MSKEENFNMQSSGGGGGGENAPGCDQFLKDTFKAPAEDQRKYRYFNQPIELIPDYDEDKPQILVHRPDSGLQWATIDTCKNVVTCIKLDTQIPFSAQQLKIERRTLIVLKDFEAQNDDTCQDIQLVQSEVVTDLTLEADQLKITKKKLTIIQEDSADDGQIPVTNCPTPP